MSDETVPPPPPRSGSVDRPRRRRRTALVTSRWAASAAVIAAMTVSAPDASAESSGSFGDPYLGDVTSQVASDDAPPDPSP